MKAFTVARAGVLLLLLCTGITACSNDADSPVSINTLVQGLVTQEAKLVAADGAASDWFGFSTAVSGNTALIGSFLDDDNGTDSGSAYTLCGVAPRGVSNKNSSRPMVLQAIVSVIALPFQEPRPLLAPS